MFTYFMENYAMTIIALIVSAVAGVLGWKAQRIYKRVADTEEKQNVAQMAVLFVEQVFKQRHGKEKMDKALATAEALLMERGIKFKRSEMVILMEAFLGEFNEAFFKDGETEPEDENEAQADELAVPDEDFYI